jgi:hypothetical protein
METPHFCDDKNWINLSEWLRIIRGKWEDVFTIQLHSLAKVWKFFIVRGQLLLLHIYFACLEYIKDIGSR